MISKIISRQFTYGQTCLILFVCVLVVAMAVAFFYAHIVERAESWYAKNQPAPANQPRPWYVRAVEFINS